MDDKKAKRIIKMLEQVLENQDKRYARMLKRMKELDEELLSKDSSSNTKS